LSDRAALAHLLALNPSEFEQAVAQLLPLLGYREARRTGGAGDLGVDIACYDEHGGLVVVQCKRYSLSKTITSPDIQLFFGMIVHHGARAGVYVTTSSFTKSALDLANARDIRTIDGQTLAALFTMHHDVLGIDSPAAPLANDQPLPAVSSPAEILRLSSIGKRFPGVQALREVDFDLRAGEVHVLFGENGAGKSTLINIIAGTFPPDEGTMTLRGQPLRLSSPHHARQLGINAVFQEFSLVPTLSVQDNLYLGREHKRGGLLDKGAIARGARETLDLLQFDLDPRAKVGWLSRAEQQMVEIAKALQGEPSILILDEPTASLTENEANHLFALIERLKAQGLGIIYITHRIQEIRQVADRVTVLRDGQRVATVGVDEVSEQRLVELMTGRTIEALYPTIAFQPTRPVLRTVDLTVASGRVHDVSLEVRAGEVVGLAGLVGSGKSEVGRAVFGLDPIVRGVVEIDGEPVAHPTPREMLDRGVVYIPPDRREEGLVATRSVRENMSLAALDLPIFSRLGILRRRREGQTVREIAQRLSLRPLNVERQVASFSGGNQQKVVLGRGLTREVKLFIFDEPTTGVDVGAKVEIYGFIKELCERGAAVLLISSDLPEIIHLASRAYVMHRGEVRAELAGSALTEEAVLANFFDRDADAA
jgi:ribose transport system ATP-binding protein